MIYLFKCKFSTFQQWKNLENRLRFDEVTAMSFVAPFWDTVCSDESEFHRLDVNDNIICK